MATRKRKPNNDLVAIAEQLAGDLAAKLKGAGNPVDIQQYSDIEPAVA